MECEIVFLVKEVVVECDFVSECEFLCVKYELVIVDIVCCGEIFGVEEVCVVGVLKDFERKWIEVKKVEVDVKVVSFSNMRWLVVINVIVEYFDSVEFMKVGVLCLIFEVEVMLFLVVIEVVGMRLLVWVLVIID